MSAEKTVTVVVPQGATLTRAADQLEAAGAIGSARRFLLLAKVFGGSAPIKAGEYRLPAHVSQSDILRSEEHTSELQSLMRTSFAVFCLNKKNNLLILTTHI